MSRIDIIEGRNHALKIIADSCHAPQMFYGSSGPETVIENLRSSAISRGGDFAKGVLEIVALATKKEVATA